MDDYSRLILSWDLKTDMAGGSLEDMVQLAVDATGMASVPVEDRTVLLSDNGAGYISSQFNEYLRLARIRHITVSPFHPQTNGRVERYQRSLKVEINLQPYDMPGELGEAIMTFVKYYKHWRYQEGLGNVTPRDVYTGRHFAIIAKRKEVKGGTLLDRMSYNDIVRKMGDSS